MTTISSISVNAHTESTGQAFAAANASTSSRGDFILIGASSFWRSWVTFAVASPDDAYQRVKRASTIVPTITAKEHNHDWLIASM